MVICLLSFMFVKNNNLICKKIICLILSFVKNNKFYLKLLCKCEKGRKEKNYFISK